MAITTSTWFPVVTLLLGFAAGSATDWLKDRRTARREDTGRRALRDEQLTTRRSEFQRTTLLELQEVTAQIVRDAGQTHHLDRMAHKTTGKWGSSLLPADLDERFLLHQTRAAILMVRVHDKLVHDLALGLKSAGSDVGRARSETESGAALRRMVEALELLNEAIGNALREIDGVAAESV